MLPHLVTCIRRLMTSLHLLACKHHCAAWGSDEEMNLPYTPFILERLHRFIELSTQSFQVIGAGN